MDHTSVPPFLFLGHVLLAFPHIYLRALRVFYATPLSLLVILMWVFLIFYSLFLVFLIDILHYYLAISVFLVALPPLPFFTCNFHDTHTNTLFFSRPTTELQGCAAGHLNLNPFWTFRGGWLAQKTAEIWQQPAGSMALCCIDAVRILHRVLHGPFVIINIFKNHPYLFIVCYITWSVY